MATQFVSINGRTNWMDLATQECIAAGIEFQSLRWQWVVSKRNDADGVILGANRRANEVGRLRSAGKISRAEMRAEFAACEAMIRAEIRRRIADAAAFEAARGAGFGASGKGAARRDFDRGETERCIVDSYWGEGAYDSEFTTDAMIDQAMGG